jgi:hypothetical protein
MYASYKGLRVQVEAMVYNKWKSCYLLSVVGPREAVRGVLAAWAKGEYILVEGQRYSAHYQPKSFRTVQLYSNICHGIGHVKGCYFARAQEPYRERLWASRQAEIPIPEEVWPEIRESLRLEGYRAVGLEEPNKYRVLEVIQKAAQRRKVA